LSVPKFVVCDSLKAAVTNPDRYDPGINRTYAEHMGTGPGKSIAVIPAM
jgi:hypothetical protein